MREGSYEKPRENQIDLISFLSRATSGVYGERNNKNNNFSLRKKNGPIKYEMFYTMFERPEYYLHCQALADL
jgi:hypothetical protein